jgi:DNA gyrase subunit B
MSQKEYSASNIQILEGLEAVRKRPSMYIGNVGTKGLHHLIWEAVDNGIDEALAGHCDSITVCIHPGEAISVTDNGRGIPTEMHPTEKRSALEVVMTVLHAGGKFDKESYKVSGGLHGVGISCVNALSTHLKATVHRDSIIYEQSYQQGVPTGPVQEIGTTQKRGTTVYFEPDETIFTTTTYHYDTIASRLRELSFLNPGIELIIKDLRDAEELREETFLSQGGLSEFVTYLDSNREQLLAQPIFVQSEKEDIAIELALSYNTGFAENVISYVNNINTIEGGTHVSGFRKALTRTLKKHAEKSGLLERAKVKIVGDDFREGLTGVIHVKVPEPQFEGQTKGKLGNTYVAGAVDRALSEVLEIYLEEHPKESKTLIQKVILAAQARSAANKAREMVQRKTALGGTSLPGKLADCIEKDPSKCELVIVEGDSAGGTAKNGRDRYIQAVLPLRGKILNVEKAPEHKIYDNEQIRNIITALGVSFGTEEDSRALNLERLRYHKLIIMTDADVDGSHINILILTFLFRHMRSLIEQGYIYIAMAPLYQVKKGKEIHYCWDDKERDGHIAHLKDNGRAGNVVIQRYKGLGEMNADQIWKTTMNPEVRQLKQVTIRSAAEADHIFSTLMGDEVTLRREFIQEHARYANLDV